MATDGDFWENMAVRLLNEALAEADRMPLGAEEYWRGRADGLEELVRTMARQQPAGPSAMVAWDAVSRMGQIFRETRRTDTPMPYVFAHDGDGIQLEWRGRDGETIEVDLLNGGGTTIRIGPDAAEERIEPFSTGVVVHRIRHALGLAE